MNHPANAPSRKPEFIGELLLAAAFTKAAEELPFAFSGDERALGLWPNQVDYETGVVSFEPSNTQRPTQEKIEPDREGEWVLREPA